MQFNDDVSTEQDGGIRSTMRTHAEVGKMQSVIPNENEKKIEAKA